MDPRRFDRIAKALADPTRVKVLEVINREAGLCCGDVGRRLPITQATVSYHVRTLAEAGLVESRRTGQQVQLWLVPEALAAYRTALGELVAVPAAAAEPLDDPPMAVDESAPSLAIQPDPPPADRDESPAARRARRRARPTGSPV
jgi:ArsR family transcriptional regulator